MDIKKIFIGNKGVWVGAAMLLSKISNFLITIQTAHLLTEKELGGVLYNLNYLSFFIPLVGLGSYQGSLRYGSLEKDEVVRKQLYNYSFYWGFIFQLVLTVLMCLLSLAILKEAGKIEILLLLSVRFFGLFLMEQAKAEYRASGDNRSFAKIDLLFSMVSVILTAVLTCFFKVQGYIWALMCAPYCVLLIHKFKLRKGSIKIPYGEFWNYNFFTAFTLQIWQWIFIIDVFMVGYFFSKESVAYYKISSMIPFNVLFIPQVIMQTEYVNFCVNQNDKNYFIDFLKNYFKWMFLVSICLLGVSYFFSEEIMALFGINYRNPEIFKILIWASVSSLFFRIPFGNLLAARGLSKYNLITAVVSLVLLVVLGNIMKESFGLKGIAYASIISISLSGLLSCILFFRSFKK